MEDFNQEARKERLHLHYPVAGICAAIAVILAGVFLNQVVVMIFGMLIILISSYGLISGQND